MSLSDLPKSVWFAVRPHEVPSYAFTSVHSAGHAADRLQARDGSRADVVRYDLADAERDKRDADAIDFILNATRPQTTEALNAYLIRRAAARKRLEALRDRLRGGAK